MSFALIKDSNKAVSWLQKAVDGGFPCYAKFEKDRKLDNIRRDPRFISLMKDLKTKWEGFKTIL